MLKSTKYCNLLAQGRSQEGEDLATVERIYIKNMDREEIRFAWYKMRDGREKFQLRPLDLTEEELFQVLKDGISKGVFSDEFRKSLKNVL